VNLGVISNAEKGHKKSINNLWENKLVSFLKPSFIKNSEIKKEIKSLTKSTIMSLTNFEELLFVLTLGIEGLVKSVRRGT
jgi:hypothetical protein